LAAGLAGDSRGASAWIFMGKNGAQRQEMGMSYDLPGKIVEKLGFESWEFMGHEGGFAKKTLGIFVLLEHPHIHRQLLV